MNLLEFVLLTPRGESCFPELETKRSKTRTTIKTLILDSWNSEIYSGLLDLNRPESRLLLKVEKRVSLSVSVAVSVCSVVSSNLSRLLAVKNIR